MSSGGRQNSLTNSLGALKKDTTTVSLAKINCDYKRTKDLHTTELLEHLPALQQLMYRVLGCQVASESIKIYKAISDGCVNLVDKFFEMQKHDALKALDIYRRAGLQVLNVNGDGKISYDDIRASNGGFSGPGGYDEDVIGSMISLADSNKNWFVEYEEFERVLNGKKGKNGRVGGGGGVMEDAFRVMDKDGDEKVGHEELKSYLIWAGFEAHNEDVKAVIRLGGGDEDGGVTFE
ncbi:putative clathrin assembly protein at2g01600 [Phtheirospermum japonicum]|uniref:Putative clathrin assembly protein at2g01600 n=1 Tax=Phtheirospermum japonicum TaxID=374723 RepID=A0A830B4J8_9LAMI|nr:putative clathrin assembly protein at2g01600 [Phtheirospermum japonicum]